MWLIKVISYGKVNMFICTLGTIIDINFVTNYIDMFLVFQCVLTYTG